MNLSRALGLITSTVRSLLASLKNDISPATPPHLRTPRQQLGDLSERHAEQFLRQQGLILVARNLRHGRGEIDLLFKERDLPIFVEVRYRGNTAWVRAGGSINRKKQKVLTHTARAIMRDRGWLQARFDAILIDEVSPVLNTSTSSPPKASPHFPMGEGHFPPLIFPLVVLSPAELPIRS